MDCEQVLQEIELYLDDELAEAEFLEIEQHLSGCGSCLERKEFRVKLRALVARKCDPPDAPKSLHARIRDILRTEPPA